MSRPQTYVKQETIYTPVEGSDLATQTVWRYFDDLSRPFQTVNQSYSAENSFDVVNATEYDDYSRPFKQFEPFEIANTGGHSVAIPANTPFTLNSFEETPLNRLMSTTPPNWYSTNFEYGHNTVADAVMNLRTSTAFAEGLLTKEVVIDPNQNKSLLFKDKRGRPVLSRKEGTTERADTYSLYDAKERPAIIVPPDATLTTTPGLIFRTFYDGANNPIFKKIPDMAMMELLYNNRDLMVAKQGGNLRTDGKWMITNYDDYGRVTQTGLLTEAGKPNPDNVSPTEVWTKSFYGGENAAAFQQELGITSNDIPTNSTSNADILIGKLTAQENYVLNGNTLTGDKILSTLFYTDYGQLTGDLGSNHYANSRLWKYFDYDFADNLIQQKRRFHTTDILAEHRDTLTNNYDHQGRLIVNFHSLQNQNRQQLCQIEYTPKDQLKTKFLGTAFGFPLQQIDYTYLDNGFLLGINPSKSADDLFSLNINYDQEVAGFSGVGQKNGNITQLIWETNGGVGQTYGYAYDYLDRITNAKYALIFGSSLFQNNNFNTSYEYDSRGNFSKIERNGVYEFQGNDIKYQIDNMAFSPIAGTNKVKEIIDTAPCPDHKAIHQTLNNTELHAVGQIIEADNVVNENAEIIYQAGTSITLMDGFHAKAGADFLAKIEACPASGYETEGFVQRSITPYLYDAEGNQKSDPNKGITTLFNYFNMPYRTTFDNGNEIEWLYDGNGTKLQKTVKQNGIVEPLLTQDYLSGGIEYRNDTLEAIYHSEGRVFFEDGNPRYEFRLADHLDNSRVWFSDLNNDFSIFGSEVLDKASYYPFGMRQNEIFLKDNSQLNYYFNNKERVGDFGLQWDFYQFRVLDSEVGRFISVDPISEQFPWVSTYNYAENEPVAHIDLWGLQKAKPNDKFVASSDRPKNYEKGYQAWVEANPNAEISQTFLERAYTAGQYLSSALPSAKFPFGKASEAVDDIARGVNTADEGLKALSADDLAKIDLDGGGRTFNHFTNTEGISGITGVDEAVLNSLKSGEGLTVSKLTFGKGNNSFMAAKDGDIFVTELSQATSSGKLNQIGVFGNKQNFLIQFSEESAFLQGAKVSGQNVERSIFTIPGNTTLNGTFKIIKK